MGKITSLCICLFVLSSVSANGPNVIDKLNKIKDFDEKNWFLENIPFIELPDKNIEDVYYYRWSSHKRHLRYLKVGTGYVVTEFVYDVNYQSKLGVINGAAGHQIYESRWLRNDKYVKDYINFFARVMDRVGNHQYSEWIANAAYNAFLVNGDKAFIASQLDGFVKIYNDWIDHYVPELGLYHITPNWDAQEQSAASLQTKDPYGGGDGFRPSHNSEMYGNAMAIIKMARLAGNKKVEEEFSEKAKNLREAIIKHLWDNKRRFFYHMQKDDNPKHELLDTREEVGFYPWRFNVPNNQYNFSLALDELFDDHGFGTAYGPSTCETRSKWYDGAQTPPKCCWWNGNSWPYSTAHTLRSVAEHLRQYKYQNPKITVDNYVSLLRKYALTQYKNNKPYVAECHSPVHDFWVGDARNHSEHYAHSTYTDNVLTELIGILPQEDSTLNVDPLVPKSWDFFAVEDISYHGFNIAVIYDKSGNKYKVGKGLSVFVDGTLKAHRDDLGQLTVKDLNIKLSERPSKQIVNYAANPIANRGFPRAYASFSDHNPGTPHQAIDGRIFYDYVPSNRWSNFDSKHDTDWLAVDFGRQKTFDSVTLHVYSDVTTNAGRTDCPTKMVVQYINDKNEWKDVEKQISVPSKCSPNDVNKISFSPVKTSQLRVVFTRNTAKDFYVGIVELEVWAQYPQTAHNTYEAEDGLVTNAAIESSDSASGHSYVGLIDKGDSSVEFSGVYVPKSGDYKVRVFYSDAFGQTSSHNILVNNMHNVEIKYPPTQSGWGHFSDKTFVEITLPLLYGDNVIQFQHKVNFAELDKIQIIV